MWPHPHSPTRSPESVLPSLGNENQPFRFSRTQKKHAFLTSNERILRLVIVNNEAKGLASKCRSCIPSTDYIHGKATIFESTQEGPKLLPTLAELFLPAGQRERGPCVARVPGKAHGVPARRAGAVLHAGHRWQAADSRRERGFRVGDGALDQPWGGGAANRGLRSGLLGDDCGALSTAPGEETSVERTGCSEVLRKQRNHCSNHRQRVRYL